MTDVMCDGNGECFRLEERLAESERLLNQAWKDRDELLAALKALAADMDRAGGDGHGMPECPWCQRGPDGDEHDADCELLTARAAIAKAEGR